MLVLTRRVGENTVIGGNIHVSVLSIKGSQVRLGIIAPTSIRIQRLEMLARQALPLMPALASAADPADGSDPKERSHDVIDTRQPQASSSHS